MSDPAYRSLVEKGEQFDPNRQLLPVGSSFEHPVKGEVPILVDPQVLAATGRMYVGDTNLARALQSHGARTVQLDVAQLLTQEYLHGDRLICGFGGFAQSGHPSGIAAKIIVKVYRYLEAVGRLPAVSVDGASGKGVPGLNGIIAPHFGVATMGISSLQGFKTLAPRTITVVKHTLHTDRQELVGSLADMFLCIAGGEGTRNECAAALRQGSAALLFAVPGYGPGSLAEYYMADPDVRAAFRSRRFRICHSFDGITHRVAETLLACDKGLRRSRPVRSRAVKRILAS